MHTTKRPFGGLKVKRISCPCCGVFGELDASGDDALLARLDTDRSALRDELVAGLMATTFGFVIVTWNGDIVFRVEATGRERDHGA